MNAAPESRSSRRARVGFRVAIEQPGQQVFAQALNLSTGGIFLATAEPAELGTSVSIVLSLPPSGRFLRLQGEVVRHAGDDEPSGFAVRFASVDEPSADVLDRFVSDAEGSA